MPFSQTKKNYPQLGGFQKTHAEYTVMNRIKITLKDYCDCVELLQPQMAVSPIEDLNMPGVKRI